MSAKRRYQDDRRMLIECLSRVLIVAGNDMISYCFDEENKHIDERTHILVGAIARLLEESHFEKSPVRLP